MNALGVEANGLAPWQWVVVGLAVVAVAWVAWKAVRLTIRPGEDDPDHVKRSILDEGPRDGRGGSAGR